MAIDIKLEISNMVEGICSESFWVGYFQRAEEYPCTHDELTPGEAKEEYEKWEKTLKDDKALLKEFILQMVETAAKYEQLKNEQEARK